MAMDCMGNCTKCGTHIESTGGYCQNCYDIHVKMPPVKEWAVRIVPINGPQYVPGTVRVPEPAATPQPAPTGNGVEILPLVIADLNARAEMGEKKYGTRLKAHNGRDALMDAYQEALDLCMYLRQKIEEAKP